MPPELRLVGVHQHKRYNEIETQIDCLRGCVSVMRSKPKYTAAGVIDITHLCTAGVRRSGGGRGGGGGADPTTEERAS